MLKLLETTKTKLKLFNLLHFKVVKPLRFLPRNFQAMNKTHYRGNQKVLRSILQAPLPHFGRGQATMKKTKVRRLTEIYLMAMRKKNQLFTILPA